MTFINYCSLPQNKEILDRIPINVLQEIKNENFEVSFHALTNEITKNYYERGWWDTTIMDKKLALLKSIARRYVESMGRDY